MVSSCIMFTSILLALIICSVKAFPSRPIIGLVLETDDPRNPTCQVKGSMKLAADYKSYIEQAGGGAVPVFVNQSQAYYDNLLPKINGVLFPGGGVNLVTSFYAQTAKIVFKYAAEINKKGDYFPLWGTCLGMQEMTTFPLNPDRDLLGKCSATENVALPLHFTKAAASSKLFGQLPDFVKDILTKENVTANYHHYCLLESTYERTQQLRDFYSVISTSQDGSGQVFVSSMEAKDYPFYAVQWHPEKNNYWFDKNTRINHSQHAVIVSQYFSNFLVEEARKSKSSFKSFEEEGMYVLNNYNTLFNSITQKETYCLTEKDIPKLYK